MYSYTPREDVQTYSPALHCHPCNPLGNKHINYEHVAVITDWLLLCIENAYYSIIIVPSCELFNVEFIRRYLKGNPNGIHIIDGRTSLTTPIRKSIRLFPDMRIKWQERAEIESNPLSDGT